MLQGLLRQQITPAGQRKSPVTLRPQLQMGLMLGTTKGFCCTQGLPNTNALCKPWQQESCQAGVLLKGLPRRLIDATAWQACEERYRDQALPLVVGDAVGTCGYPVDDPSLWQAHTIA